MDRVVAITTEDAVDAVAAALVAGNNVDVTYNDALGTIIVDVETLTKADVGLGNVDNTAGRRKPVSSATADGARRQGGQGDRRQHDRAAHRWRQPDDVADTGHLHVHGHR